MKRHKPVSAPPAKIVIPERLKEYAANLDIPRQRKRPRSVSLFFCDLAQMTVEGKVNLLGIFDRIYVHPEVQLSPPFFIYGRTAEAFNDSLWVRVFDPEGQPHSEIRCDPVTLHKAPDREEDWPNQIQIILPLQLRLRKQGVYWFDLAYRDDSLGGAGMVVQFRKLDEGDNRGTDTFE